MYQEILVIFAIALALFFLGRRLLTFFRPGQAPSCESGCAGCNSLSTCAKPKKKDRQ
jgi:hypothetical protein